MPCWLGTCRRGKSEAGEHPIRSVMPTVRRATVGAKAVGAKPRRRNRAKSYSGAPRSTKTGTILSPWPFDAAACHALQPAMLRQPAILHYASRAAIFPISQGGPVTASIAAMPINPGIDVLGQREGKCPEEPLPG